MRSAGAFTEAGHDAITVRGLRPEKLCERCFGSAGVNEEVALESRFDTEAESSNESSADDAESWESWQSQSGVSALSLSDELSKSTELSSFACSAAKPLKAGILSP